MHAEEYHDQVVIGRMTEDALQAQILETARVFGWRTYHTRDSRRSNPGFPDLVLGRPPRLIFAELKTARGRVTAFQQLWLDDVDAVGKAIAEALAGLAAPLQQRLTPSVEAYLWRPADIVGDTVVKVLR